MKQDKENEKEYISQIKELCLSDLHSDISFVVEGASFPAHKNILAVRCKYFASMFASNLIILKFNEPPTLNRRNARI